MKLGVVIALALGGCAGAEPAAPSAAPAGEIEITVQSANPRPDPAPLTTAAADASAAVTPDDGLSPTCETYTQRLIACTQASLASAPPEARAAAKKGITEAMQATRDAWKKMPHAELEQACRDALSALSANPSCPP